MARMGLRGNAYKFLVERYERRTVKRSKCRWKENMKMDRRCDRRTCTGFRPDSGVRWALLYMTINVQFA